MPIYEYKCQKCGEAFEFLARGAEKPKCPNCGSRRLKKLVSSFSAAGEKRTNLGGRSPAVGHCCCGSCHCGGCH